MRMCFARAVEGVRKSVFGDLDGVAGMFVVVGRSVSAGRGGVDSGSWEKRLMNMPFF